MLQRIRARKSLCTRKRPYPLLRGEKGAHGSKDAIVAHFCAEGAGASAGGGASCRRAAHSGGGGEQARRRRRRQRGEREKGGERPATGEIKARPGDSISQANNSKSTPRQVPKHALAGPLPGGLLVVGHGDAVVVVGDGGGLGQVEGEGTRPLSREGFRQVKEKSEQKSDRDSLFSSADNKAGFRRGRRGKGRRGSKKRRERFPPSERAPNPDGGNLEKSAFGYRVL